MADPKADLQKQIEDWYDQPSINTGGDNVPLSETGTFPAAERATAESEFEIPERLKEDR